MRVGVPRETTAGERRVALVPDVVARLPGVEVSVESSAGLAAGFSDQAYAEAGATMVDDAWTGGDVVAKVAAPTPDEARRLADGQVLVAFLQPLTDREGIDRLGAAGVIGFAMESIPRISRAQSMDALSSQATVAGYKAALIAADRLPRFLPMLTTAAGTIAPAKVLVLGAGIVGEETEGGYARELTPEEQERQQEALEERIPDFDAVITTAAIPGRPAPRLVPAAAVEKMRLGSVIVDLAADTGGNCELTRPGEVVDAGGVTIVGPLNLPSTMPFHASQLYARNVASLLGHLAPNGELALDWDDEITSATCVTRRVVAA